MEELFTINFFDENEINQWLPENLKDHRAEFKQKYFHYFKNKVPTTNCLLLIDDIPVEKYLYRILDNIIPKGTIYNHFNYDIAIENKTNKPIHWTFLFTLWLKRSGWVVPKYIKVKYPKSNIILLAPKSESIDSYMQQYLQPVGLAPLDTDPQNFSSAIIKLLLQPKEVISC